MFSPGSKRVGVSSRSQQHGSLLDSPATPVVDSRSFSLQSNNIIPNRPSTGTPAPWAPRLSVLARVPQVHGTERDVGADPTKPVYVGEFPQVVRDEQASMLQRRVPDEASVCGGLEKEASLAWIVCVNKLFLWSYLSPAPTKFVVLEFPQEVLESVDIGKNTVNSWLVSLINWDQSFGRDKKSVKQIKPAGIVLCNKRSRAVVYWPDILEQNVTPLTSFASSDESKVASPDGMTTRQRQQRHNKLGCSWNASHALNSLIASAIPGHQYACIALACTSNGEIWQFHCSPAGINRKRITEGVPHISLLQGYPRSLTWRFPHHSSKNSNWEFFLLTDCEIQCFNVSLDSAEHVSNLWSQEIIGTDGDLGMKKDLAGQKEIWPLDLQVDSCGKVITILVAAVCKDRISSSSYMQYSLLSMQYKSRIYTETAHERALEKKAPIQVIIPKARAEENLSLLFSMRLRVGGKPPGSAVIISGDGTATVSHYFRNDTRLYQFDLPYDAGKVLDASVLSTVDDDDEGAWIILTEKAGIWAIPEKAVVVGGVKPPERSLSRKGSSNESSVEEERRNLAFSADIVPRRASSDGWDAAERQRLVPTGIGRRTAQDEESEAFLTHLFNEFLSSGQVNNLLEKLQTSGAFEREGEANVFARMSKSIVDTLAKHWTRTRGAEILAMAVVSSQLLEKQQKHQKFLEFLALSKCHEELCSRQRLALQTILEHGEKLAALIQLRELQNLLSQNRSSRFGSPNTSVESQMSGALWDLIQLVGEQARRNSVLLLDRDNAEVFYSKVSDLEDFFYCLEQELEYLISQEQPSIQIQRACELSNACVGIIRTACYYKTEHHLWYPPPEGLTPWFCQLVVRNGLWSIASFMLQVINGTSTLDKPVRSNICSNLEALAEVLLEAYAGAVTARIESGEEHQGLLNEYWKRRDALLDALYEQANDFAKASSEDLNGGAEKPLGEAILNTSAKLLSLAKRHGCYAVLWRISCDLNDSTLLKNLMHETTGPDGGFCYFVFEQLYEKRQLSRLLRLGEEFPEELSIFLKHHPDLLWLHELYLHQFSPASETLHMLALSQEKISPSAVDDGGDHHDLSSELKLSDRKRLLYLSKIAAMAGKDVVSAVNISRIEADLKILKLQEEITKHIWPIEAEGHVGQQLLHPEDLIELCLKGEKPELTLWAFDLFAWTSSSFRKNHRKLLEECWKSAADQDDWSKLHEAYESEGWSDEELLENLSNTTLFQASSRCYGPLADTFEEGFDHVLPLRSDVLEPQILKDICPSVEAILMEHKSFPEAGKLMNMALMLGSGQGNGKLEEDQSPME